MLRLKLNNLLKTVQTLASGVVSRGSKPSSSASNADAKHPHGYRRPTAPTALPLYKIITTKLFPMSASESFQHWKSRHLLDDAQWDLLQLLSLPNRDLEVVKTAIGRGNTMNEVCITPRNVTDPAKLNHFVLIHGYGAGLGFFLKNFEAISQNENWCIHALDLPGYGCSSRPVFDRSIPLENYFIDSLEKWRSERNIDSMLMCSHSLGAYLSVLYTMKYPNAVKKLLCISPAGIYRPPQPPGEIPAWFDWLWEQNVSPFSLVRNSGPFGSMITSGWTSRRFAKLTQEERERLHRYTYAIFNARGSGEYYMPQILGAGAVAKVPLVDKIHNASCDIAWVYGDDDWMPKEGGVECSKIINSQTAHSSEFLVMENCGHHIYLDNYPRFNEYVLSEMKRYEKKYSSH